jgi:hypothetical protein
LTIASTGKDPTTGKLVTSEYRVEGPVMLCLTTTAIDLDEELLNRCLVLTINETAEQTAAIQQRQRQARTLAGLQTKVAAEQIIAAHRAAQTLLQPLAVVNPYAESLTFAHDRVRLRRDHQKYLALIDAIALLHQCQRKRSTLDVHGERIEYIEVQPQDIELANRLAHAVLGRSLDELPPQTRRVLSALDAWVMEQAERDGVPRESVRFTRRTVRGALGLSDTQLRVHLDRLVQLEHVLVHGGKQGQLYAYSLSFDGDAESSEAQLAGLSLALAEPGACTKNDRTSRGSKATSRGSKANFAGGSRGLRGGVAAPSRGVRTPLKPKRDAACSDSDAQSVGNARSRRLNGHALEVQP